MGLPVTRKMAMKKTTYILLIAAALMAVSCTRGFVYHLLNNTGHDIVVLSYDTVGSAKESPIASGARRDVRLPTKLVIKTESHDWR